MRIEQQEAKTLNNVNGDQFVFNMNNNKSEDAQFNFVITRGQNITSSVDFIGRNNELTLLNEYINSGTKLILLSGIGGMGKTEICLKLYNHLVTQSKNKKDINIENIGYLTYDNSMDSTISKGLIYKTTGDSIIDIENAWAYLEKLSNTKKLLLIIDNMNRDDDKSFNKIYNLNATIILTSRIKEFKNFKCLPIDSMDLDECKKLFVNIYGDITKYEQLSDVEINDNLKYIIKNLAGSHTLTVSILASLSKDKEWSITKLRRNLEKQGFKITYRSYGEILNLQNEYEKLYNLSGLSNKEINILETFSMFPYEALKLELCNEWLLHDAQANEDDEIFNILYYKGWLYKNTNGFSLHPVFAEIIFKKNAPILSNHKFIIRHFTKLLNVNIEKDISYINQIINFIILMSSKIRYVTSDDSLQIILLFQRIAAVLYELGEYKEALGWLKKARKLCKDKNNLAIIYTHLGRTFLKCGKFNFSLNYLESALKIRKVSNNLKDNELEKSNILVDLGLLFMNKSKYDNALECFKESLRLRKSQQDKNLLDIANVYNCIGGVYSFRENKELDKALKYFTEALEIREKFKEENPLSLARTYNNLGNVYYFKARLYKPHEKIYHDMLDMSIEWYFKSLELRESLFSEKHPDIARIYNNLGNAYIDKPDFDNAEKYLIKALTIRNNVLGPEHYLTGLTCMNVACFYYNRSYKGDHLNAINYADRALAIYIKTYGKNNEETANIYYKRSMIYKNQKNYVGELENLFEAYWIFLNLNKKNQKILLEMLDLFIVQGKDMEEFKMYLKSKLYTYI